MSEQPGRIRRSLTTLRRGFWWAETALISALLLSMVGVSALRIVVRVAHLRLDIMWADAYLKHSVLWITVLGAALATRDRNHINIDVVGRLLKGRWKAACLVLTDLFAAVVCAASTWACCMFVQSQRKAYINQSWDSAGDVFGSVPAWCAQAVMPAALALMAVRFLIQSGEDAVAVWAGPPEQDDEAEGEHAEPDAPVEEPSEEGGTP